MAKILVCGVGPLPPEASERLMAPGLRVWIMAEALAKVGHQVALVTLAFGEGDRGAIRHHLLEWDPARELCTPRLVGETQGREIEAVLGEIAGQFHPEMAVATTDVMGDALARARLGVPTWFDFYGAPMIERQQQAAVHDSDGGLAAQWKMILPCLLSGDRFSACSGPQRLELVGELAACGRLNRHTAGLDLVHVLPAGTPFTRFEKSDDVVRGSAVPDDAVIALWAGGFNTWTDVETLHAGLTAAMDQRDDLHFVSTGGAIAGHCETVYPRFEQLIAEGPHTDRFHLQGWVDLPVVQSLYLEADFGICIDQFSYEGVVGSRTRLMDWMRAELPIITTPLCELSEILIGRDLARSFAIGDAAGLTKTIVEVAADADGRRDRAERATAFLDEEFSNAKLMAPLLEWAADPQRAPDIEHGAAHSEGDAFPRPDNSLASLQMGMASDEVEEMRGTLARLRGSRLVRMIAKMKGWDL